MPLPAPAVLVGNLLVTLSRPRRDSRGDAGTRAVRRRPGPGTAGRARLAACAPRALRSAPASGAAPNRTDPGARAAGAGTGGRPGPGPGARRRPPARPPPE